MKEIEFKFIDPRSQTLREFLLDHKGHNKEQEFPILEGKKFRCFRCYDCKEIYFVGKDV